MVTYDPSPFIITPTHTWLFKNSSLLFNHFSERIDRSTIYIYIYIYIFIFRLDYRARAIERSCTSSEGDEKARIVMLCIEGVLCLEGLLTRLSEKERLTWARRVSQEGAPKVISLRPTTRQGAVSLSLSRWPGPPFFHHPTLQYILYISIGAKARTIKQKELIFFLFNDYCISLYESVYTKHSQKSFIKRDIKRDNCDSVVWRFSLYWRYVG